MAVISLPRKWKVSLDLGANWKWRLYTRAENEFYYSLKTFITHYVSHRTVSTAFGYMFGKYFLLTDSFGWSPAI